MTAKKIATETLKHRITNLRSSIICKDRKNEDMVIFILVLPGLVLPNVSCKQAYAVFSKPKTIISKKITHDGNQSQ